MVVIKVEIRTFKNIIKLVYSHSSHKEIHMCGNCENEIFVRGVLFAFENPLCCFDHFHCHIQVTTFWKVLT
jgi:hypothetical protein